MSYQLIEHQVEEAMLTLLRAALDAQGIGADIMSVVGFLTPVPTGLVKDIPHTSLALKILPRFNDSQGSCILHLSGEIVIAVSAADSADGTLLAQVEACVMQLIEAWNLSADACDAALSVAGVFEADGFLFVEGGSRDFDTSYAAWITTIPFRISGRSVAQT